MLGKSYWKIFLSQYDLYYEIKILFGGNKFGGWYGGGYVLYQIFLPPYVDYKIYEQMFTGQAQRKRNIKCGWSWEKKIKKGCIFVWFNISSLALYKHRQTAWWTTNKHSLWCRSSSSFFFFLSYIICLAFTSLSHPPSFLCIRKSPLYT